MAIVSFVAATLAWAGPARADLIVVSGSTTSLNGGTIDLGCTDVVVGGTLNVDTGSLVNVRHVTIQAGGTIDGGSGTITLGGDWANAGQFVPGTGVVRFRDQCALAAAEISGNTTFATASFVSATGKNYTFAVGTQQTIGQLLEIAGTTTFPIQFRSGAAGQVANINLLGGGTQLIQHVGVTDVWATGQWLAPSLTNEGGGGNANRWFGSPVVGAQQRSVPTIGEAMLALLAAALATMGAWSARRRKHVTDESRPPRP